MRASERYKFWCVPCDFVAKSHGTPACPLCRRPMKFMGKKWPVGKKGKRVPLRTWRMDVPPGEVLLKRLLSPAGKPKSWRDISWP